MNNNIEITFHTYEQLYEYNEHRKLPTTDDTYETIIIDTTTNMIVEPMVIKKETSAFYKLFCCFTLE